MLDSLLKRIRKTAENQNILKDQQNGNIWTFGASYFLNTETISFYSLFPHRILNKF